MILAYFVTIGHYGFWLPNDGRGSGSSYVGSTRLLPYGEATGLADRTHSRASVPHDEVGRKLGKDALLYPPVQLCGEQAWSVAQGFAACIKRTGCAVFACSIMPDHTHLVIGRHRYEIEKLVRLLKGEATRRLNSDGNHPFRDRATANGRITSMWGKESWNVFLNSTGLVREKIEYVEQNPVKQGLPRQQWRFVTTYDT